MILRTYPGLILAGLFAVLLMTSVAPAQTVVHASTLLVTSTGDTGAGTLRAAVTTANAGDVIIFDPSLINQTIQLNSEIAFNTSLTITTSDGAGGFYPITIQQTAANKRIFTITSGAAVVTIAGLTMSGANMTSGNVRGAAIFNQGTLTLDHDRITGNSATDGGGGIYNHAGNNLAGSLTVLSSTIDNNTYTSIGGSNGAGIYSSGSFAGGCSLATPCLASVTIVNSTISGNYGPNGNTGSGEGIFALLTNLKVIQSTIAFNRLGVSGKNSGNLDWNQGGGATLSIRQSIIADSNNAGGADYDVNTDSTSIGSQGYNDIQNRNATTITGGYQATDLADGTNPLLNTLLNNGGSTPTHALPAGSPALDKIPPANCTDQNPSPLTVDQRDATRPSPVGGLCDIGAYEKSILTATPGTLSIGVRNSLYPTTTLTAAGGKAPYLFSIGSGALPNGLSLSNSGVISGTPTAIGAFTFGVQIADAYGSTTANPIPYTILVFAEASSTVTVNTNADPGNANCATSCSLRTALAYASSGDTIGFANSLTGQTLTLANSSGTLNVQSNGTAGNPSPLNNLTIDGSDTGHLAIDGNNNQSVFTVPGGITAALRNLTLQHGKSANGGGVSNSGTLTISNSTIANNTAISAGGGIATTAGSLTISNSTISNNSAPIGGGVAANGTTTIANSTIADNAASSAAGGGGITSSGGLTIGSTILAGNSANGSPSDIAATGSVTSLGTNLVQAPGSVAFTGSGDLTNVNPLLGSLASNGGSTQTLALPINSPGYQKGNCNVGSGLTISADQRGQPRKSPCDIGAFEETFTFSPASLPPGITGSPYSALSSVTGGGASPYAYTPSVAILDGLAITANPANVTVSGTPVSAGTFTFSVLATDANGIAGSIYYSVSITDPTATPTNTATSTPTDTATFTATSTPTNTATNTPSNTATATLTASNTATSTSTPSNTATATFTASNTASVTDTPSNTATATVTASNTATGTSPPSNTPTATFTASNTATVTNTPSNTLTPTSTSTPTLTTTPSNIPTITPTLPPPPHLDTVGILRGSTFYLQLHNSTGGSLIVAPFLSGAPVAGDWTGSGVDSIGSVVVIGGATNRWTVCTAIDPTTCAQTANQKTILYGNINDVPFGWHVANGQPDGVAVFRPSSGLMLYHSAPSTGYSDDAMVYGVPGDQPLTGDWTGAGHDSPGIYRPSTGQFFLSNQVIASGSITTSYKFQYGNVGTAYIPLAGQWLATLGHDGVGLFGATTGIFYLKNDPTTTGAADNTFLFGNPGDQPVAGHWTSVYPPIAPPAVLLAKTAAPSSNGMNGSVPGGNQIGG